MEGLKVKNLIKPMQLFRYIRIPCAQIVSQNGFRVGVICLGFGDKMYGEKNMANL